MVSKLRKIISVVDRYNRGETPPGSYPRTETEVKNVILANKMINFINSFSFGRSVIDNIVGKEHHYNDVIEYGDYFLNVTKYTSSDYIIVTNQKEIDVLLSLTNKKTVLDLSSFSVNI